MERRTEDIDAGSLAEVLEHALEQGLGHAFDDRRLLRLALTHRSYANERGDDAAGTNYERLEFLGDAVLGLVAGQWLYERYPDAPEGHLARRKSYLVSARVLAQYASALGVGPMLRLGVGEERSGGRSKASILADAVEALFGAVYLDGGLEAAQKVIHPFLARAEAESAGGSPGDAKTALQERLQAAGLPLPSYCLVAEEGPDHEKVFTVDCRVGNQRLGTGEGGSKKLAEQRAAAAALAALDLPGDRP
ncbi:MAG: ribonuclease III [Acidobacteria bacterium]|nr:MAG: ribonuclease III [Acidobacteriota bacterium]